MNYKVFSLKLLKRMLFWRKKPPNFLNCRTQKNRNGKAKKLSWIFFENKNETRDTYRTLSNPVSLVKEKYQNHISSILIDKKIL